MTRQYEVFVPESHGTPAGLVVFLHGTGGTGLTDCMTGVPPPRKRQVINMTKHVNQYGFVAVCPTATQVEQQLNH